MDVLEAISLRRSVRHYKPDAVPDDVLDALLEAMRLAPSGKNCQPWKFVIVRDQEIKAKAAAACAFCTPSGRLFQQRWVNRAPVIIVACGSERSAAVRYHLNGQVVTAEWDALEAELATGPIEYESGLGIDLAIALDHLSLAAASLGLGTCWIAGLDEQEMREILAIPDDVRVPFAMTLGYPLSWPDARPRKRLEEVVCYDRYA